MTLANPPNKIAQITYARSKKLRKILDANKDTKYANTRHKQL